MDAAADPGFYDELVERIAEHQSEIIERLLDLPIDGIWFSDDWGYQDGVLIGPDRWRRFLKPRLARMYDRVHQAGKYVLSHCCGSIADIVPDVIELQSEGGASAWHRSRPAAAIKASHPGSLLRFI